MTRFLRHLAGGLLLLAALAGLAIYTSAASPKAPIAVEARPQSYSRQRLVNFEARSGKELLATVNDSSRGHEVRRELRTTDGGRSWTDVTLSADAEKRRQGRAAPDCDPVFVDSRNGWCVRAAFAASHEADEVYRTTDGGRTWMLMSRTEGVGGGEMDTPDSLPFGCDKNFGFTSPTVAWAGLVCPGGDPSDDFLYTTSDGGAHWAARHVPLPATDGACSTDSRPQSISVQPPVVRGNRAALVLSWSCDRSLGDSTLITAVSRSTDGGRTWVTTFVPANSAWVFDATADPDHWRFSDGKTLIASDDAGRHWRKHDLSAAIQNEEESYPLVFASPSVGWIAPKIEQIDGRLPVWRTIDGGRTWEASGIAVPPLTRELYEALLHMEEPSPGYDPLRSLAQGLDSDQYDPDHVSKVIEDDLGGLKNNPEAYWHLARGYARDNRIEDAVRRLERMFVNTPKRLLPSTLDRIVTQWEFTPYLSNDTFLDALAKEFGPGARETVRTHVRSSEDRRRQTAAEIQFVALSPGTFLVACAPGDADCSGEGEPVISNRIEKAFEIGKYEITQVQWEAVMGTNPSDFKSPVLPAENLSWDSVQDFVSRLNAIDDGFRYRLPTNAEWEYAARAGSSKREAASLSSVAWCGENYGKTPGYQTHPGGKRKANAWGLYDMIGNVREWVADEVPKQVQDEKVFHFSRGGAWNSGNEDLGFSVRQTVFEYASYTNNVGFRLVRQRIR